MNWVKGAMSDIATQWMTVKQYAAHRGVADKLVYRLRSQGRLVLCSGRDDLIDWASSDEKLDRESDPLRGGDRSQGGVAEINDVGMREAVRRERLANAQTAELKLGELTREFTRTKQVDRTAFTLARTALERLRVIPGRLRYQLAAESDPTAVEAILDAEIQRICEDMRKATDDYLASLSRPEAAA